MAGKYESEFRSGPNFRKWAFWLPAGFVLGALLFANLAAYYATPIQQPLQTSSSSSVLYVSGTVQNDSQIGANLWTIGVKFSNGGAYTFASPFDIAKGIYVLYAVYADPVYLPLVHPLLATAQGGFVVIQEGTTGQSALYSPTRVYTTDTRGAQVTEVLAIDGFAVLLLAQRDVRRELPIWRKGRKLDAWTHDPENIALRTTDKKAYDIALAKFAREIKASDIALERNLIADPARQE